MNSVPLPIIYLSLFKNILYHWNPASNLYIFLNGTVIWLLVLFNVIVMEYTCLLLYPDNVTCYPLDSELSNSMSVYPELRVSGYRLRVSHPAVQNSWVGDPSFEMFKVTVVPQVVRAHPSPAASEHRPRQSALGHLGPLQPGVSLPWVYNINIQISK